MVVDNVIKNTNKSFTSGVDIALVIIAFKTTKSLFTSSVQDDWQKFLNNEIWVGTFFISRLKSIF